MDSRCVYTLCSRAVHPIAMAASHDSHQAPIWAALTWATRAGAAGSCAARVHEIAPQMCTLSPSCYVLAIRLAHSFHWLDHPSTGLGWLASRAAMSTVAVTLSVASPLQRGACANANQMRFPRARARWATSGRPGPQRSQLRAICASRAHVGAPLIGRCHLQRARRPLADGAHQPPTGGAASRPAPPDFLAPLAPMIYGAPPPVLFRGPLGQRANLNLVRPARLGCTWWCRRTKRSLLTS